MGKNVWLIQDDMFYTKQQEKPGIAIFLDFRKAFDTDKCCVAKVFFFISVLTS